MKLSYLWALLITAAVGFWLGSPYVDFANMALKEPEKPAPKVEAPAAKEPEKLFPQPSKEY